MATTRQAMLPPTTWSLSATSSNVTTQSEPPETKPVVPLFISRSATDDYSHVSAAVTTPPEVTAEETFSLPSAPSVSIMSALNLHSTKPATPEASSATETMSTPTTLTDCTVPSSSTDDMSATFVSKSTEPATLATTAEAALQRNHLATKMATPGAFLPPQGAVSVHPGKLARHQLPLDMKIEAIRLNEEQGLSARGIRDVMNMQGFKCGKTQIQNILKRKHEWIEQYAQNTPLDRKRKLRKTANEEINVLVCEWFEEMLDNSIPINGPMLQAKAVKIARELGITTFKGSNGWLESFRKRHNISFGRGATSTEHGVVVSASKEPTRVPIIRPSQNEMSSFQIPLNQLIKEELPVVNMNDSSTTTSSNHKECDTISENDTSTTQDYPQIEIFELEENDMVCSPDHMEEEIDMCDALGIGESPENTKGKCKKQKSGKGKDKRRSSFGPKLKSIQDVAMALQDIRLFLATRNYTHLLDSCMDLEDQVAEECMASRQEEEGSTVLDHLNPLDTRPAPNSD